MIIKRSSITCSDKMDLVHEDVDVDQEEINKMIDCYLENDIEPTYEHVYCDCDSMNEIVDKRREDLIEKLERLDMFRWLVTKNSFPCVYEGYLFGLLKDNQKMFCKIMNNECEYYSNWHETDLYVDFGYCVFGPDGTRLCKNCEYYFAVQTKYKKMNNANNGVKA